MKNLLMLLFLIGMAACVTQALTLVVSMPMHAGFMGTTQQQVRVWALLLSNLGLGMLGILVNETS
ncbi:MAG: hypothetical protein ACYDHY_09430 [Acidiferrobacterales bacterium]